MQITRHILLAITLATTLYSAGCNSNQQPSKDEKHGPQKEDNPKVQPNNPNRGNQDQDNHNDQPNDTDSGN
jgi:hypothetical protein